MALRAFDDHLMLYYRVNGEDVRQTIRYRETRTNFGGTRRWFECPRCRRACGGLYGGPRFYCRECHGLCYESQYEAPWERARSKAARVRKKLGGSSHVILGGEEPFPVKPKGMHWATYDRLRMQDEELLEAAAEGYCIMAARTLGLDPASLL